MSKLTNTCTLSALPFCGLDDENFQLTLFEHSSGSVNFDPERRASLKFNPLLSTTYKNFSLCKDLDPDHNFYRESDDGKYYTEGSFNNALAEVKSCLNQITIAAIYLCFILTEVFQKRLINFLLYWEVFDFSFPL